MRIVILVLATVVVMALLFITAFRMRHTLWLFFQLRKLKRQLDRFRNHWKMVEKRFSDDLDFRDQIISNPSKMASFFKISDYFHETDFSCGLSQEELFRLFQSNPDIIEVRVREYLDCIDKKE